MVVESRLIERGWRRQIKLTLKEGVPCGLHFLCNDAGFWLEIHGDYEIGDEAFSKFTCR